MKITYLFLALIFVSVTATAEEAEPTWTTIKKLSSGSTIRLHWVRQYEGFESVTQIDLIRKEQVQTSIEIVGQPVFNNDESLVALPNCWDGGCALSVRVVDLKQFKELPKISLERESFLECSWAGPRKLKIVERAMWSGGKTEEKIVDIK